MGTGVTEITVAQLSSVVQQYSNVIYMNDPSDSDLLKTVQGHPRTIIINLGQLLNIASGEVQGDALAADEIAAGQIAAGAVAASELADGTWPFQGAYAVATIRFTDVPTNGEEITIDAGGTPEICEFNDDAGGAPDAGDIDIDTQGDATADNAADSFVTGYNAGTSSTRRAIKGGTNVVHLVEASAVGTAANVTVTATGGTVVVGANTTAVGEAVGHKSIYTKSITLSAEDANLNERLFPLPFDASAVVVHQDNGSGVDEFNGTTTIVAAAGGNPAYVLVTEGAAAFVAARTLRIVAFE